MMITRCPHCGTTFRVTPEQLRLGHGQVRCGACMASFDALASLAEDGALTVSPQSAEAWIDEHSEPTIEPELTSSAMEPFQDLAPPVEEEASAALPIAEGLEPAANIEAVEPPVLPALPVESPRERPPEAILHEPTRLPRHWPWLAGCLLAIAALVLQGAVHFRSTLAARLPESRPWLAMLCDPLGCALDLPRRIDLIEIESSDLAPGKRADGHLRLVATLRNRASFAQAWPYLELTLTSAGDRALLRRALAPNDYLTPPARADAGFAAGTDQTVQLDLQATDTPAVGYRLYLFYP